MQTPARHASTLRPSVIHIGHLKKETFWSVDASTERSVAATSEILSDFPGVIDGSSGSKTEAKRFNAVERRWAEDYPASVCVNGVSSLCRPDDNWN